MNACYADVSATCPGSQDHQGCDAISFCIDPPVRFQHPTCEHSSQWMKDVILFHNGHMTIFNPCGGQPTPKQGGGIFAINDWRYIMKANNASKKPAKWISSSIAAMGYLAGVREVDHGKKSFLACDINLVEGPADGAGYRRFSCIVVGEKAKELIEDLCEDVKQEHKILMGVILRGFKPTIFTYQKGKHQGESDVSFQSNLMYIDWIHINGQEVYKVAPEEKEEQQRLSIPGPTDDASDEEDNDDQPQEQTTRRLNRSSRKPAFSSSRKNGFSSAKRY